MADKCARAGFGSAPTRVDAVDGADLDVSDASVASIFNLTRWRYGRHAKNAHQDHGYRPRVIGCALSHVAAWRRVAASDAGDHSLHLILEDDVEFDPDFFARWAALAPRLAADYSWDLVHLGVLDDRDLYDDAPLADYEGVKRFSGRQRSYGAGAFAYVLRPRTARWLLARAERDGIMQAVDWWIVETFDELVCYKASPPLAASPQGDGRDSDNNEFYDQDRLLLDDGEDAEPHSFSVRRPEPGEAVAAGEDLDVRAEMTVVGDAKAYFLRHMLMRICYAVRRLDGALTPPPQTLGAPQACVGVAKGDGFKLPGTLVADPGWYVLNASLTDDRGTAVDSALVAFEARAPGAPDDFAAPPALGDEASRNLVPIEVAVDGRAEAVDCAGRDLFDCVSAFCYANRISPEVQCVASLVAAFQAQALSPAPLVT